MFKNITSYLNENVNLLFCIFLIILSLYFLLFRKTIKKKEGFDIGSGLNDIQRGLNSIKDFATKIPAEINSIGSKITNVGSTITNGINSSTNIIKSGVTSGVNDIKSTATNVTNQIDSKLSEFLKQVEDITKKVVLAKIMSFFEQIKYILDKAIVQPFQTLFFGIGTVFTSIFDIIKMIGDKIVGLPGCMPYYMIDAIINGISGCLRYFLPKFIMSILSFIYDWTLNPILRWTRVSNSIDQCKSFNVNDKVEKMDGAFKDIANTFRKDFGQIPPLSL
jgi:archaellum component FlaC